MWQKSKEKRFPYKCLSSPPKNHFKICPFSKWKEAWILQPWHHSGLHYNRSRDPTMCSLQRSHFPVLLSSLFIVLFVFKATFVFGTSEKVKFSSTLMLPDSKGVWESFSKNEFLAWFIDPVSVELQLTLETKFGCAIWLYQEKKVRMVECSHK